MAKLTGQLEQCDQPIQERMVWHLLMCEDQLGLRVGEGPGIGPDDVRHLEPLATQTLIEDELHRAANLGRNGPSDVYGLTMTHCAQRARNRHPLSTQQARGRSKELGRLSASSLERSFLP